MAYHFAVSTGLSGSMTPRKVLSVIAILKPDHRFRAISISTIMVRERASYRQGNRSPGFRRQLAFINELQNVIASLPIATVSEVGLVAITAYLWQVRLYHNAKPAVESFRTSVVCQNRQSKRMLLTDTYCSSTDTVTVLDTNRLFNLQQF